MTASRWKVTATVADGVFVGVLPVDDPTIAEYKFLDQLSEAGINVEDWEEVTTEGTSERPTQPYGHESKCPCFDCDAWAYDLLFWEQEEVDAGRNPWKD